MTRLNLPGIADAIDYESYFNDGVWRQAAAAICARHNLPHTGLRRSEQGENIIFFVDERFAIKIFSPFRESYAREAAALEFVIGKLIVKTPAILYAGEIEGWSYLVMTMLYGLPAREAWPKIGLHGRLEIASHLGSALKSLHDHAAPLTEPALNRDWLGFVG